MKYLLLSLTLLSTHAWTQTSEMKAFDKACKEKAADYLSQTYAWEMEAEFDDENEEAYEVAEEKNDTDALKLLNDRARQVVEDAGKHKFKVKSVKYSPTAAEGSDEGMPGYTVIGQSDKGAQVTTVLMINSGHCLNFTLDGEDLPEELLPEKVVNDPKSSGKPVPEPAVHEKAHGKAGGL